MRTKKGGGFSNMLSKFTKRLINRKRVLPETAPIYVSRPRTESIPITGTRTATRTATKPRSGSRTATRPRSGSRSRTSLSPSVAAIIKDLDEIHNVQNDATIKLEELMKSTIIAVKANAIAAKANADALEKKANVIVRSIQGKKNIRKIEYQHATNEMEKLRALAERNALDEAAKAESLIRRYDSKGGKNSKKRFRKQKRTIKQRRTIKQKRTIK